MAAIEAELQPWAHGDPLGETVATLTAYWGVGGLTALTRVVGWRRCQNARSSMCFTATEVAGRLQRPAQGARTDPHTLYRSKIAPMTVIASSGCNRISP
jgi:hypothetical protein